MIIKEIISKIQHFIRKIKVDKIREIYPEVMSTKETLDDIIKGKSIARYGDGELQLMIGKGLGKAGKPNEYQVYDKTLSEKLRNIIKSPTENCIIAIDKFNDEWNDKKDYKYGLSYFENFWYRNWSKLKNFYDYSYRYGCTATTRVSVFKENSLNDVKKIWNDKKVLFVVGNGSHFVLDHRLFDNIKEADMYVTKGKSSFSSYNEILTQILEYDKDWLIFISLGPTATVLAYELSLKGYQALDMGHLPNCYLQAIGERKTPEEELVTCKQFDKNIGLYKNVLQEWMIKQ